MKINPALPEVHRSLGRYYMFTGKSAEAEKCFLTAIKYNPKYAVGYRTIGWLKRSFGQYQEALTWARKSLELAPTDLETLLLLSLIHMDERRFTVAISTLQRAIELGPDYGRAYYNLGAVYMKLGVFDVALENLIQAAKFKGDPNCYLDAGYVHMVTGKLPEACSAIENSINAGYFLFASHYYLGFVLGLMGKHEQAAEQYRTVVVLTELSDGTVSPDLNYQGFRALALIGLGKREEAAAMLDRLEIEAAHAGEVLANVARGWALLGDPTRSRSVMERAVVAFWGPTEKELAPDPHFASLGK
ncbi:MAG: tetratricopeptide repeat protein [candidate division Zixibacteria bacterium]|nr:tetratricopeptide repeat protein [candidate division Zixibacteria bacterium]